MSNAKTYLNSILGEAEVIGSNVKVYFADLDLESRNKILTAIDEYDENLNVFGDELVREKIEEALKDKPLFVTNGKDLINKMNIDL